MRLSKSAIGSYRFCPYKFMLEYVTKTAPRKTNPTLQLGTRFHEFADKFFERCQNIPYEQWDKCIPVNFSPVEIDWANWFVKYEQQEYLKHKEADTLELFFPIEREQKIEDKNNRLVAIIDRVNWVSKTDGTVYLVEYKTSKKIDPFYMRKELGFYAYVWNENRDTTAVAGLVINPYVKDVLKIPVTEKMITKAKQDIFEVRKAVLDCELPRKCTEAKFAMCGLCKPDEVECGAW